MKRLNTILLLLALAALMIFALGGCSSDDGVTPDEQLEFTAEDTANQAATVTMAMVRVLQEIGNKASTDIREINQEHVYGTYWDDGDNDHVWTEPANMLYVDFNGLPHEIGQDYPVNFNITATEGVANGSGNVNFFTFTVTFTISGVVLDPGNFPVGGQILISNGTADAEIDFYAGHTATVIVGDTMWDVNMDTGEITLS
jgi:hypothetical protein